MSRKMLQESHLVWSCSWSIWSVLILVLSSWRCKQNPKKAFFFCYALYSISQPTAAENIWLHPLICTFIVCILGMFITLPVVLARQNKSAQKILLKTRLDCGLSPPPSYVLCKYRLVLHELTYLKHINVILLFFSCKQQSRETTAVCIITQQHTVYIRTLITSSHSCIHSFIHSAVFFGAEQNKILLFFLVA